MIGYIFELWWKWEKERYENIDYFSLIYNLNICEIKIWKIIYNVIDF